MLKFITLVLLLSFLGATSPVWAKDGEENEGQGKPSVSQKIQMKKAARAKAKAEKKAAKAAAKAKRSNIVTKKNDSSPGLDKGIDPQGGGREEMDTTQDQIEQSDKDKMDFDDPDEGDDKE